MEFKAGMESVDFNKINRLLTNFSIGSHFQKKLDREAESINTYIQEMLQKLDQLPDDDLYRKVVDDYISDLLKNKDLSRTFIHVDMDAFYAHVEMMDNKELHELPVAVGSLDMLVTSNYKAREFGVRSGIPGVLALTLCPQLEIVPLRMDRYREVSEIIRAVFYKFDKNYVSPSLDEGCLDISQFLRDNPSLTPLDVACQVQDGILQATTLTSSMGIACSPLLAKLASEVNKPNGYLYLPSDYDECMKYLSNIAVKKLPGIGKVRQTLLDTIGIQVVEEIMDYKYEIYFILPEKHREILFKHALAIPIFPTPNLFKLQKKRVMISKERNCKELYDETDLKLLMKQIFEFCVGVLEKENKLAMGLIVKVQDYSFKVNNVALSLYSNNPEDLPVIDPEHYSTPPSPTLSVSSGSSSSDNGDNSKKSTTPTKKTRTLPDNISVQENSERIWDRFEKVMKSFVFAEIRCVGLKLVNLINNPNPAVVSNNNNNNNNNNNDIMNEDENESDNSDDM